MQIAVLMTCHNRRQMTLRCLGALREQVLPEQIALSVYVVDDGSLDGTGEAVSQQFPEVHLLRGNGSLFWCGGMRLAWDEARKGDYDHYLWLNDDTSLFPVAVADLLDTLQHVHDKCGQDGVVVGAIRSPDAEVPTYGGMTQTRRFGSLGFSLVAPQGMPVECDTMNGNCVLIPRSIALGVGNLSPRYTHGIGDLDYGLRARQAGFTCWLSQRYVGTCSHNASIGAWFSSALRVSERFRRLYSPLGVPPMEYAFFLWRHAGLVAATMGLVKVHFRAAFPKIHQRLRGT